MPVAQAGFLAAPFLRYLLPVVVRLIRTAYWSAVRCLRPTMPVQQVVGSVGAITMRPSFLIQSVTQPSRAVAIVIRIRSQQQPVVVQGRCAVYHHQILMRPAMADRVPANCQGTVERGVHLRRTVLVARCVALLRPRHRRWFPFRFQRAVPYQPERVAVRSP